MRLTSMTIVKLVELRDEITEHLAKRRKELEQQISHLDSFAPGGKRVSGTGGRRSSMRGVKVAPKYRGPKGETWAGRGVYPRWLAALLKEKHKIEEYAIGRVKLATANKKTAKKVGRKPGRKAKGKRS